MGADEQRIVRDVVAALEELRTLVANADSHNPKEDFLRVKEGFDKKTTALKKDVANVGKKLTNVFIFCEEAFGDGQEMLILVTELSLNPITSFFIAHYGCEKHFAHNKDLLFYERQCEIIVCLDELDLELSDWCPSKEM